MERLMTGHRIIKNLTKRGNSILGVGCYSAALSASNGIDAIKVGTNINDPWLDFKSLVVEKFRYNKHLPLIKSFYYDINSEYYVCVMERLDQIKASTNADSLIESCKEYVQGYYTDTEFEDILSDYTRFVPEPKELIAVLKTIKEHTTCSKFGALNNKHYNDDDLDGRQLDMHRGNFMLRDGVLVIIDPWCNVCMDDVEDLSLWAEDEVGYSSYA
jgi:hypothetical protein